MHLHAAVKHSLRICSVSFIPDVHMKIPSYSEDSCPTNLEKFRQKPGTEPQGGLQPPALTLQETCVGHMESLLLRPLTF